MTIGFWPHVVTVVGIAVCAWEGDYATACWFGVILVGLLWSRRAVIDGQADP